MVLLFGGEVTKVLADRLIDDVRADQDELPLIQHGLMRLWRRRTTGSAHGLAEAPAPFLPSHAQSPDPRLDTNDLAPDTLDGLLNVHADAIFDAGWGEDDFHYAVMICAMFNMMNRIMDGYGVRNTAEFRLERGRMLATQGYKPVAEAVRDQ